jgi:shikimate dehydrogenase
MKKYLVIGNPIGHSLSPQLHNYWIKKNNINAVYNKKKLNTDGLKDLISKIKSKEINGVNVTVPFKKEVISYLDELSIEAESSQSVNTICLNNNKIIGHNTDITGFELAIKDLKYDIVGKKILIIGAGGVVASIIFALNKMKASQIILCNRTKSKTKDLKNLFKDLKLIDWGEIPNFDMVINATSIGLKDEDELNLEFLKVQKGKFFYDLIYNPKETNFLKKARETGNATENGKKMFIYQAAAAFKIWHEVEPKIDEEINSILD